MQESKQKVAKVTSLVKNGREKSTTCILSHEYLFPLSDEYLFPLSHEYLFPDYESRKSIYVLRLMFYKSRYLP